MFKKIRKCFVCLLLLSMISACSVNDENPYKEDVRNSLNNYIESYIDNKQYENDIANVEKEAEKVWNGITDAITSDNDEEDDILKVDFLDVGQGDCTLISYHNHYILIDSGDNSEGTFVQNYLEKQGVEKIDYLILTHPHADHIGGADVIISKFDIENILMPDKSADTKTYRDVIEAIKYKDYQNIIDYTSYMEEFSIDELSFEILSTYSDHEDMNDYSLCVKFIYKDVSLLFTGDATASVEKELVENDINLQADILKIPHHGSKYSSSDTFIKAVAPTYGVISCGEDNDYGHPHSQVLNVLRKNGVKIFRTDEQGSIVMETDGTNITWNTPASETWQSGDK